VLRLTADSELVACSRVRHIVPAVLVTLAALGCSESSPQPNPTDVTAQSGGAENAAGGAENAANAAGGAANAGAAGSDGFPSGGAGADFFAEAGAGGAAGSGAGGGAGSAAGGGAGGGAAVVPVPVLPGTKKLVFVSSERYSGNLGGLAGADATCQSLAAAAGKPGVFAAWLSTLTVPAWKRLSHAPVPYVLASGAVVANDWADFTSGTLRHKIDETEGDAPPPNALSGCNPVVFWTATDERGAETGNDDCNGWTDASDTRRATLGVLAADDTVWSQFCVQSQCSSSAPIVCLEQ